MTHYIIQVGNFFGSSFSLSVFHLVRDLERWPRGVWSELLILLLPLQVGFVFFFGAFDLMTFLYRCSTISLTSLSNTSRILSSPLYSFKYLLMLKFQRSKVQNFFSSKKIYKRVPPSCFLSSLESSTVSWLSHDLLLRMSLTLAKESGISAFCRGLL